MAYLNIIRTKQLFLVFIGALVLLGCRKEKLLVFPAANSAGGGSGTGVLTTPISGTYWSDINPDASRRINALATLDNKIAYSTTNINSVSGVYNGSSFSSCSQSFFTFGSGSGIEKIQQSSNGRWFGTGSMGTYGTFEYDTTDHAYPWAEVTNVFTNTYAAADFEGQIYVACGVAPRIRSLGAEVGNGLDGAVFDLIEFDGELIAGGGFAMSGTTLVNNVARWNGTEWLPLGTGLDGTVMDFEIYNGQLVAVGSFDQNGDGDVNCKGIAVWDGTTWNPLGTGLTGSSSAGRKALANGSELIIGGQFSSGGGVLSPNVIKWNGSSYQVLGGGAPNIIGEMAILNGKLYIANQFLMSNANFLLRLD